MQFTENQQRLLDCICVNKGGKDINEIINETGLSFHVIEQTIYSLISKGVELTVLGIREGSRSYDSIKRVYLSPYDANYKELMGVE